MQVRDKYRLRIFLIAGETIAPEALQNILTDLGHEAISFNYAYDLFDNLEKASQPADLILVEPNMPMEEDDKVIREIYQLYPDAGITVMADYTLIISSEVSISDSVYAHPGKLSRLAELEILGQNYYPKTVLTSGTYRI